MKGFSIKKIAAVAVGAALVGSALAPVVSAAQVAKGDIYGNDGTPSVNVVVGSAAAMSDGVWAANIAAKIAEKASVAKEVTVSGSANGAACTLEDLTVDLTVGGTTTFSTEYSKKYTKEINSGNEIDANVLTYSNLPPLYYSTDNVKVGGSTSSITIQEKVGVTADVSFDQSSEIQDLVAKVDASEFYYLVDLGSGLPLDERSNGTNYTYYEDSGSTDSAKIPFFGEMYEINKVDFNSSTANVKLVKTSAREEYNEGDTITDLKGKGSYDGQDLEVKIARISQSGTAVTTYEATVELYDSEGTLINTQSASAGTNLADIFVDSDDNPVLASNLFLDVIAVGATTGVGYVQVTKGTDTVILYDNQEYPYDSTSTTTAYDYYKVDLVASGGNFTQIKIFNNKDAWTDPEDDLGPLYPYSAGQSLTGKDGSEAVFGQSLPDGTAGKEFVKVRFQGLETNESRTSIQIGKVSNGPGVHFYDVDDGEHTLPFTIELSDVQTGGSFDFDSKTIYYDLNKGSSSTAQDVYIWVTDDDLVNGRQWDIDQNSGDADVNIHIAGIGASSSDRSTNLNQGTCVQNADGALACEDGDWFVVDDVNFLVSDANTGSSAQTRVAVDGWVAFGTADIENESNPSSDAFIFSKKSGGSWSNTNPYGKLLYSADTMYYPVDSYTYDTADYGNANRDYRLTLTGSNDRQFYYAFGAKYNDISSSGKLWLTLGAQAFEAVNDGGKIQYSKDLNFLGTSVTRDGTEIKFGATDSTNVNLVYPFYFPDNKDFNSNMEVTNYYQVATFKIDEEVDPSADADFNVYIDTKDGGMIGPFDNSNLTAYGADVQYYEGSTSWDLKSGTTSTFLKAGYTNGGTKVTLNEDSDYVEFSIPQDAVKAELYVLMSGASTSVTGGETLTVANGETGTTSTGTAITVNVGEDNYTLSCEGGEAGECVADPAEYMAPASVPNPMVYLDSDAPAGAKVIVGGPAVNTVAAQVAGVADRLVSAGDKIMEVDDSTGDILVMGYTAQDTVDAAKELINTIDGFA